MALLFLAFLGAFKDVQRLKALYHPQSGLAENLYFQLWPCASRMVEEKFGEGSDEHFQALQELSDACLSAGKPGLAAPMLIILSRLRTYARSA